MNRQKIIVSLLAIVSALVMVLSASFAWFLQSDKTSLNVFAHNVDVTNGSVLHDDFDGANKDVYVENTGNEPIFVRIKLDEYMEIQGIGETKATSMVDGAWRDDISTWLTHKYIENDVTDDGEKFHDYYSWTMGGGRVEYKPATANSSDVVGKYLTFNSTSGNKLSQIEPDGFQAGEEGNLFTPACTVMKMSDYNALSDDKKTSFVGWLLDEDGWAYWHQKLQSGTATGLLLDKVDCIATPEQVDSYYYAINVILETVTESDLKGWTEGAQVNAETESPYAPEQGTESATEFLKGISSTYVLITADMSKTESQDGYTITASEYDIDDDGYFNEEEYSAYKIEDERLKTEN